MVQRKKTELNKKHYYCKIVIQQRLASSSVVVQVV